MEDYPISYNNVVLSKLFIFRVDSRDFSEQNSGKHMISHPKPHNFFVETYYLNTIKKNSISNSILILYPLFLLERWEDPYPLFVKNYIHSF